MTPVTSIQAALLTILNSPKHPGDFDLTSLTPENWNALTALAVQQKISPILYEHLHAGGWQVPEEIREKLKSSSIRTAVRNVLISKELNRLVPMLQKENIPIILLKGVYLSESVYNNIGLRPMADIDLLIKKMDVPRAIGVLTAAGFATERPFWMEADGDLHYHAPVMYRNDLPVELHWNLTRESNLALLDPDSFWDRTIPVKMEFGETLALGLSDLLLHLAVHMAYGHRFHHQLLSLYDLRMVLGKFGNEIDWDEIIQRSCKWGAERGTYLVFRLGVELLNIPIPKRVMEQLKPSDWDEKVLEAARTNLFQEEWLLSENYVRVMQGKTPGDRIRGLFNGLFPSRAVMAMEYGIRQDSWRVLTRYPQHITTRIKKYWRRAWQLLGGDRNQKTESESAQTIRDWLGV